MNQVFKKLSFALSLALLAIFSTITIYAEDSVTYEVKKTVIKKTKDGLKTNLNVWYPAKEESTPVFVFLSGLNGIAPSSAYSMLFTELASKGITVVVPSGSLLLPNMIHKRATEFKAALTWMKSNFGTKMEELGNGADMEKLIIASHSSGSQPAILVYKEMYEEISALFFLDPVDGDPFEMGEKVIAPNEVFDYGTPVFILAAGLGGKPGFNIKYYPSCAPENISRMHYYNAFSSPKWYINASEYGHVDMLNTLYAGGVKLSHFCSGADKNLDKNIYRTFIADSIQSFVEGAVEGKCDKLKNIENQDLMAIDTELLSDGYCNRN